MTIPFSVLANHQIRNQAKHSEGCQPGDCRPGWHTNSMQTTLQSNAKLIIRIKANRSIIENPDITFDGQGEQFGTFKTGSLCFVVFFLVMLKLVSFALLSCSVGYGIQQCMPIHLHIKKLKFLKIH